jgi:hypothetical protein
VLRLRTAVQCVSVLVPVIAAALLFALESKVEVAQSPLPVRSPSGVTFRSPAPLTPRELLARTFARLETYPIPPFAVWVTFWHVRTYDLSGGSSARDTWLRYAVRDSDGIENISTPQPSPAPSSSPAPTPSPATLPKAWVLGESIGLFATVLRPPVPAAAPSPSFNASGLKTIAIVAATREDYRIDLVGTEMIDGHVTEHLRLTPVRDRPQYNLRGLWVDAQSFDLRKARFVFAQRPDDPVRNGATINVYFGPVLQYWIVTHSDWLLNRPHTTQAFDLATLLVAFPPMLPDWIFDQSAYDRHQKAGEPDLLDEILKSVKPPSRN